MKGNDLSVFDTYESNVRSYIRHFPAVFDRAEGSTLVDETGRAYIDFFCGAGAVNYGHNNPYIRERLVRYLAEGRIIHALDMGTVAKREFIACYQERILKPRGLEYKIQFPAPTGTNAVEAALKIARRATGRPGVFALMGSFHGMTVGALACTSDACARGAAGIALGNVVHVPPPYMMSSTDEALRYVEMLLADDHSGAGLPAAFILEAVQADGGIYPLPGDYLRGLAALLKRHGVLLIVDDIQMGSCRTGRYFSFEHAGIRPDIVTVSKSAGGYGIPFAMTLFRPDLDVMKPGEHTGTFRGNQLAFVAAKAGVEFYLDHDLDGEVTRKGELVRAFLEREIRAVEPRLAVRGIGLAWGVDFNALPNAGASKAVVRDCFEHGLVAERAGRGDNVVKIMPPLVVTDEEIARGLAIFKEAVCRAQPLFDSASGT